MSRPDEEVVMTVTTKEGRRAEFERLAAELGEWPSSFLVGGPNAEPERLLCPLPPASAACMEGPARRAAVPRLNHHGSTERLEES